MRERTVYFSPKRLAREAQKRERQSAAAKPIAREQKALTQEEEADSIRRRWMRREGAMPCPPERPIPDPYAAPAQNHVLITQRERMFAHLLLKGEHSDQKCAELAGFPPTHAGKLKKRRQVKEYIEAYNQQFMMMMLNRETETMLAQGITREALVQRLWIIANTASERTRDSYESQIEAIDKISEILGFKIQPRNMDELFRGKTDEQISNYLAYGSFDQPVTQ